MQDGSEYCPRCNDEPRRGFDPSYYKFLCRKHLEEFVDERSAAADTERKRRLEEGP